MSIKFIFCNENLVSQIVYAYVETISTYLKLFDKQLFESELLPF